MDAATAIIQWIPILIYLGCGILGARINKDTARRLTRLGLLWRLGTLALVIFIFSFSVSEIFSGDLAVAFWGLIAVPISSALNAYWAVDRLRDIGTKNKILAYLVGFLLFTPFINLYLLLRSGVAPNAKQGDELHHT